MIFLLIAQVQDIEEQIETDFLSEIDKIQKPFIILMTAYIKTRNLKLF